MSQTEQWLNDIPLHSSRPMGEAEIDALRVENRASRFIVLAVWSIIGICWLVLLMIWMRSSSLSTQASDQFGLAGDVLLFATIVAVYRSRNRLNIARQVGRDVAMAKVLQFKTDEDQWRRLAPALRSEIRGRYFASDEPHTVEVLPVSGRLHTLDGNVTKAKIVTPLRETAPIPSFAALAAQWLQPVEGHASEVSTGGRELSGDEYDEIHSYATGAWKRPLFWTSAVTLWGCLVLSDMLHERLPDFAMLSIVIVVGYPLVVSWRRLIRAGLISYRLGQDIAARRVIIVGMRVEDSLRKNAEGIPQRIIEILPKSHLVWTESGRPAPWRRLLPGEIGRGS